jgi:hypothetical protein
LVFWHPARGVVDNDNSKLERAAAAELQRVRMTSQA